MNEAETPKLSDEIYGLIVRWTDSKCFVREKRFEREKKTTPRRRPPTFNGLHPKQDPMGAFPVAWLRLNTNGTISKTREHG